MREISFMLPLLLPSLNKWMVMHWRAREKYKKNLRNEVFVAMHQAGIRRPDPVIQRCTICVARHSSVQPDMDNMVASMKPLLDSLVTNGIIAGDSPRHIQQLITPWVKVRPRHAFTVVGIVEVPCDS